MSKQKLIILIIFLVGLTALFFAYLYFFPGSKAAQVVQKNAPNFFPFGSNVTKTTPGTTENNNSGLEIPNNTISPQSQLKLKKVSSMPIAGFGIFNKEVYKDVSPITPITAIGEEVTNTTPPPSAPTTEFIPTLRYADKATGNIYQARADKLDERKLSSTIIPQIHDGIFAKESTAVVLRYLKEDGRTIASFLGALPADTLGADTSEGAELKGIFLPDNTTEVSVSPDDSKIFYLYNTNNVSFGVVSGTAGEARSQVLISPFTEWLVEWPNFKMITLNTKPASGIPGYMYALDPEKKDLNKVLGGINGLTTNTSPTGKMVLYSSSSDNSISLGMYDISNGNSIPLGIKTLPEKCTWTKAGDSLYCAVPKFLDSMSYPDSWYKGLTSFSDEIWKVDAESGSAVKIADPVEVLNEDMDATKLTLDSDENYLFFINKKDSYLWELRLR